MNTTRRKFIRHFGVAAAAIVSFSSVSSILGQTLRTDGFFSTPDISTDPVSRLTSAHFSPFVNTFVRVQTTEAERRRSYQLEIAEVKELRHELNESRGYTGECFSVLFRDSARFRLSQDVYQISHPALGEFSLLLVPVGLDGNAYEAIINRVNS